MDLDKKWELKRDDIKLQDRLGGGNYGEVYRAKYNKQVSTIGNQFSWLLRYYQLKIWILPLLRLNSTKIRLNLAYYIILFFSLEISSSNLRDPFSIQKKCFTYLIKLYIIEPS